MKKKILDFFSVPYRLMILNGVFICLMLGCNFYFQAFCVPSNWTEYLLFICLVNATISPFRAKRIVLKVIQGFLDGITFMFFLYCIVFLEELSLLVPLIFLGLGIVIFTPHFFLIQIGFRILKSKSNVESKVGFYSAVLLCFCFAFFAAWKYKQATLSMSNFYKSGFESYEYSYFNEKILGMHFIYHTRICVYDGWRPPIHEPMLIVGLWFNQFNDPLHTISLQERLKLYRKLYPYNEFKLECSCGVIEASSYHSDSLWD